MTQIINSQTIAQTQSTEPNNITEPAQNGTIAADILLHLHSCALLRHRLLQRESSLIRQLLTCLVALITAAPALANGPQIGPIIKDYGPVFEVPKGSYNLDKNTHYKVSMDASATGDSPGDINRHFVSAARFLNMHAKNGIAPDNIDFALVVHGPAGKDLLDDASYKERYQQSNPNTRLLEQLGDAGVTIYLCGQSAAYMNLGADEMNPTVTMAVSAMTAHVRLQSEGYTLIPF